MINGQMVPTVTVQLIVRTPAIGDDGGILVHVSFNYVNQSAGVSFVLRTNSQKNVFCFAANSPYHPLTIHQASFIVLPFTKFGFVHFNRLT